MTAEAPASLSISAEMSPVKAPDASAWQSWPPIASALPAARAAQAAINVAGGQTMRSTLGASRGAAAVMRSSSARGVVRPFIFQLPATSGRRAVAIILPPTERQALADGPLPRKSRATNFPPLVQRVAIKRRDPYDGVIRGLARLGRPPHPRNK